MHNPADVLKHFVQIRKTVFEKVGHVIAEAVAAQITTKTAATLSRAALMHQVKP